MKTLVDDLLLLARLDETRAPERVAVDLSVIAADACRDAVTLQPDRPVTLDAPAPVVVAGDEDHLRQAVGNLVTNAWTHTPEGTPIEVSAVVDDGQARVEVRDHGPGLDDEAAVHVFDRFWQANPARSGGGAGLGLSIVAAVAEEHGGSASASNAPGGGARFVMCLPLDARS
jgi:two-component system OmpR family sensor kinase